MTRLVALIAVATATVGVFVTWTSDGPVRLDGTQGPNNGWLVLIVALLALAWIRPMARGSWTGVIGVLGASVVMAWTAIENWLDNRQVIDATVSYGLLIVLAASVALICVAVTHGVLRLRRD